ncbi:hypothetical protein F5X99DRAFT_63410 [Biscogniauxia marginata]|nr:hypothetical protein F5X99DRAFT_63410 [Biscogniauxia marginata]
MYFKTLALLAIAAVSVTAAPGPAFRRSENSTDLQLLTPEVSFSADPGCAGAGSKQIVLPGKCVGINAAFGTQNKGMMLEYLLDSKDLNCALNLYTNAFCFGNPGATETYPAQKQEGSCVDVSQYASLKANCSNVVLEQVNAVGKTLTGGDLLG